ncbi:MAG: glycogen synthase GlgA [Ilumatobacteraceae bacterium]
MNVLFVSSECYPLAKTGGLADVVGALPLALAAQGVEARVLLPRYPGTLELLHDTAVVARLPRRFGGEGTLIVGTTDDGLRVVLVDLPHLFDRPGGLYVDGAGRDWADNDLRFGALSWVAAAIATGEIDIGWRADVVHLHDWQAALTAAYLHYGTRPAPPSLLTIHNLAFQGVFDASSCAALDLPPAAMGDDGIEFWGRLSFLKAGVKWCTHLSTVSPTYAQEILTVANGMGFDGLLRERSSSLTGIVNGIDTTVWNPAADAFLVAPYVRYSTRRLDAKAANKAALQAELGLHVAPEVPLFCVVSRLTSQKGIDLLVEAIPHVLWRGAQFAVLGTGERELEDAVRRLAEAHPGQVVTRIGYDEALSHRLQAGADAIVVPSRFEPCGLTQLYGLRYGTLPVVARVGGLADTVIDANEAAMKDGVATGFQFTPVDTEQLGLALGRACDLFWDPPAWRRVQKRAMGRDVGWDAAAAKYMALYERIVTASPRAAQ